MVIHNTGDETLDAQLHEAERRFYQPEPPKRDWYPIIVILILFAAVILITGVVFWTLQ